MDNKMKSGFALLITIGLLTLFAILSISIVETKNMSNSIDRLKYLHLQAIIHMKNIKQFIIENNKSDIEEYQLKDERFELSISSIVENNQTKYDISIQTIDSSYIRLYAYLEKTQ